MATRQLSTTSPSIRTEHAPHSPSPQPSFVPVTPRSSRSTSSNRREPTTSTYSGDPLSVKRTLTTAPLGQAQRAPSQELPGFHRAKRRSRHGSRQRSPARDHPSGARRFPWLRTGPESRDSPRG